MDWVCKQWFPRFESCVPSHLHQHHSWLSLLCEDAPHQPLVYPHLPVGYYRIVKPIVQDILQAARAAGHSIKLLPYQHTSSTGEQGLADGSLWSYVYDYVPGCLQDARKLPAKKSLAIDKQASTLHSRTSLLLSRSSAGFTTACCNVQHGAS